MLLSEAFDHSGKRFTLYNCFIVIRGRNHKQSINVPRTEVQDKEQPEIKIQIYDWQDPRFKGTLKVIQSGSSNLFEYFVMLIEIVARYWISCIQECLGSATFRPKHSYSLLDYFLPEVKRTFSKVWLSMFRRHWVHMNKKPLILK